MMHGVELLMDVLENWEWRYVVSSHFPYFLIKLCKNIDFQVEIQATKRPEAWLQTTWPASF